MGKTTKSAFATAFAGAALALTLGLVGCAGNTSSAAGDIDPAVKADAKAVIKAASNVLIVTEDLGLTDADSPATISMGDPAFATFYENLKAYRGVNELELSDCTMTVSITAVTAATAREDSQQTNYRYAIRDCTMTVNGKTVSYSQTDGFSM